MKTTPTNAMYTTEAPRTVTAAELGSTPRSSRTAPAPNTTLAKVLDRIVK